MSQARQEPKKSLEAALESIKEDHPFNRTIAQASAMKVKPSILNSSLTTELKHVIREIAIQKKKRIFAEQARPWTQKEAEDALAEEVFGGFEKRIPNWRNHH